MKIQVSKLHSDKLVQVRIATGRSLGDLISEAIDLLEEKHKLEQEAVPVETKE